MGQADIVSLLKMIRLSGDDNFYTIREIRDLLNDRGLSDVRLASCLIQLEAFGFLDVRLRSDAKKFRGWFRDVGREYRIKKRYV